MKSHSISSRLITAVLLVEVVTAVLVTAMALFYEQHSHFRSFDVLLRGRADSVLGAVQDAEDPEDNVMLSMADLSLPEEDIYQVWDEKGRLLGRSPNWQGIPLDSAARHSDGYFNLKVGDNDYRALLLHGLRVVDPGDKGGGFPRHVTVIYGSRTGKVWHAVLGAVQFYAIASLVLLPVTGLLMWWLLNRSLAPLRALTAEAAGVSINSWRFSPPQEARAIRELAPLVTALENTLQRLEQSFVQQRRFVSDAAHELKTSVAVVKSSLQLLTLKPRSTPEYQAGLERCETDCIRMEELVAKMLTLARVENAGTAPGTSVRATDISACLRWTAEQFSSMAELRGISLVLRAADRLEVALPEEECSLLCSNLLMNALQHSARGTRVTASAEAEGGSIRIKIEDQGEGIPSDILPHVFERFYRGDPSRNRNTGGTGLGLSICKAIVDAAGGEITIQSDLGKGTTVLLRLPPAPASRLHPEYAASFVSR